MSLKYLHLSIIKIFSPQDYYKNQQKKKHMKIIHLVNLKFIGPCVILIVEKNRPTRFHLFYYFTIYCSACFEC